MKIVDLFRELSYGKLSNLALSDDGAGHILEEHQPQLIQYTQTALTELHKRFILSEKSLLIELVNHITSYHLRRKYAETSGSDVDWPYIKDLPGEPFLDDVLKILQVYDSEGRVLPLNNEQDPASLFTPAPTTLQVPYPTGGTELCIVYQADHYRLDDRKDGPNNILDQEIDIPIYLKNALQLYIAYQVFSNMNGQENIVKGQEFLAAYEADCLRIEERDLANQSFHTSHDKLEQRGFV